jgi:hypothetical protein
LTRQEVEKLKRELEIVKAHQQRALNDGTLTDAEKERLQKEIERLNRDIRQQMSDEEDRN